MKRQISFIAALIGCIFVLGGCGAAGEAYDKGMAAFASGDYEKAEEYLKKALDENKERAEYYIGYGMVLNEQGRYEEALKEFDKAYQDTRTSIADANNKQIYYGKAIASYYLQDYEKGLEFCDEALELKEPSSIDSRILCSKGAILEAVGDIDEALACYQKVIDKVSDNWQAYYRLSAIYQEQGDEDAAGQAQGFLEKALKDNVAEAEYYLGMLAAGRQDADEAQEYLNAYVSRKGADFAVDAYHQLISYAVSVGDYEKAREYLEHAQDLADEEGQSRLWYDQIILLEKQGEYGEARRIAQEYLQEYPEDAGMSRELKFLRTRDKTAKGKIPVASSTEQPPEAGEANVPGETSGTERTASPISETAGTASPSRTPESAVTASPARTAGTEPTGTRTESEETTEVIGNRRADVPAE